jgi:hypothetical protein
MAVPDDLAAAELHFFAVGGEVLFDFDPQLGIGQADLVADGGAEHVGVGLAGDFHWACPEKFVLIVPTLCVGMHPLTLCVTTLRAGRGASQAAFPRGAWERSVSRGRP